jgi:hypothetical protein
MYKFCFKTARVAFRMLLWLIHMRATSFMMRRKSSFRVCDFFWFTKSFMYPHKQKSRDVKSGERDGQICGRRMINVTISVAPIQVLCVREKNGEGHKARSIMAIDLSENNLTSDILTYHNITFFAQNKPMNFHLKFDGSPVHHCHTHTHTHPSTRYHGKFLSEISTKMVKML